MFKKDSFQPVISVSLTWETFEQYALWQLLLGNFMYSVNCTLVYILQFTRYNLHGTMLFEQYALWQLLLGNFTYSVNCTLVYIVQFTRYNVKGIFYGSILKINSKVYERKIILP